MYMEYKSDNTEWLHLTHEQKNHQLFLKQKELLDQQKQAINIQLNAIKLERLDLEQKRKGAAEAWDELEKSVVAHVADDVKVSIHGRTVEMVIIKALA